MSGIFTIYLLLFSFLFIADKSAGDSCWSRRLFGGKTLYNEIARKDVIITRPHLSCKAIQINMVHRHGHRYPDSSSMRRMRRMANKLNMAAKSISPDVKIQLPWKCPFEDSQSMLLTRIGEKDFNEMGFRIKTRFPELFVKPYTPTNYKFRSTCRSRCKNSAKSLAAGLFHHCGSHDECKYENISLDTLPCSHDPVLRFYAMCDKYDVMVDDNRHYWSKEAYKFMDGKEIEKVLRNVNSKLGYKKSILNLEDVWQIFTSCSYEIGMFGGKVDRGICSLLNEQDFQVMEYLSDIEYYYKLSSGHKLNYEIGCPLVRDIYHSLKNARDNQGEKYSGIFRAGHAETIGPLAALLGVHFQKNKLKANNYKEMMTREFRSACIIPFSANFYFILYKCNGDEYKIQLYENEHLVKIPCCKSEVDCSFDTFLKCYKNIVDNCNLQKMCKYS